jgi:hypothetical protein
LAVSGQINETQITPAPLLVLVEMTDLDCSVCFRLHGKTRRIEGSREEVESIGGQDSGLSLRRESGKSAKNCRAASAVCLARVWGPPGRVLDASLSATVGCVRHIRTGHNFLPCQTLRLMHGVHAYATNSGVGAWVGVDGSRARTRGENPVGFWASRRRA